LEGYIGRTYAETKHWQSRVDSCSFRGLLTLYLACRAYGPIGIEVQVAGFIVTIEAEFSSSGSDLLAAPGGPDCSLGGSAFGQRLDLGRINRGKLPSVENGGRYWVSRDHLEQVEAARLTYLLIAKRYAGGAPRGRSGCCRNGGPAEAATVSQADVVGDAPARYDVSRGTYVNEGEVVRGVVKVPGIQRSVGNQVQLRVRPDRSDAGHSSSSRTPDIKPVVG
jgi:hypothetical protein